MKKICISMLLVLLLMPIFSVLAQNTSAGFIPSDIWYSKDPFTEGEKIKIYTVLFNPDSREFSGTVKFFDKETLLGKKDFRIEARQIKDISIDWTVTVGNHAIFAKIENAQFLVSPGKYEKVIVSDTQTEESKRTVNKKIVPKIEESDFSSTKESGYKAMENLEKFFAEETPDIIAKPIIAAATSIEAFRNSVGVSAKTQKAQVQIELKSPTTKDSEEKEGRLDRPFKYVKYFFHTLVSFVFNNKFIFYGLSAFLLFYIFRFIWRKIFS